MMIKPTEGIWEARIIDGTEYVFRKGSDEAVANCHNTLLKAGESAANAKHIALCCNCHENLVELLKRNYKELESFCSHLEEGAHTKGMTMTKKALTKLKEIT